MHSSLISMWASSAIRNWSSSIGKYALQRLTRFLLVENEALKHSRDQQIEYIAKQLRDLQYIYRDPDTKVSCLPLFYFCNNVSLQTGAYCSSAIIEIFAVHQQLVAKTNKFHGYPAGALALCAAAVSYFHDSD